jgi:hypothetical protein
MVYPLGVGGREGIKEKRGAVLESGQPNRGSLLQEPPPGCLVSWLSLSEKHLISQPINSGIHTMYYAEKKKKTISSSLFSAKVTHKKNLF